VSSVGQELTITRRHLPHWQVGGSTYFITFCLRGTVHGEDGICRHTTQRQRSLTSHERQIVKKEIVFWHPSRWTVHILAVMPDHTHILVTPAETSPGRWYSLSTILHSVKRGSALKINPLRGRRGALWQSESFDRIVRDEREFHEKATYILSNAVKAGLVADGWEYDGLCCEGMDTEGEARAPRARSDGRTGGR
jgi:REP element-mobilizing transposase RayT